MSETLLTRASSGGIAGQPSSLPVSYVVRSSYSFGPGVNLADDRLQSTDLTSLLLNGANLTGDDLTGDSSRNWP
jgi:uncharacterized protein YjbI with pentapeptide repeats